MMTRQTRYCYTYTHQHVLYTGHQMELRWLSQQQFGATTFTAAVWCDYLVLLEIMRSPIKRQILPEAETFEDSLETAF